MLLLLLLGGSRRAPSLSRRRGGARGPSVGRASARTSRPSDRLGPDRAESMVIPFFKVLQFDILANFQ